jgi:hypothetical protein
MPEVERLRDVWTRWKGHRDSDIDFYLEFIQSHQEVLHPHVIVLYRDAQPDAILIGRLERTRLTFKIGHLLLSGFPVTCLTFVYGGLRGNSSEENCRELVGSILDSLRQGEADGAFLHHPDTSSALYRLALQMPGFGGRDHCPIPAVHHWMRLPQNIDQVFSGLSRDHRSELRRKTKKLIAAFEGRVEVKCFREPGELDGAIAQLEAIAQKTYQRVLGVGFVDTPLMRRLLHFCAEKGWLRAYILYLGDVPCSFWVGTVCDGSFCSDYLAFDPAFGDYSPGNFLLIKVIEDLCAEGLKEIDFGWGGGRYKERFGNLKSLEASVCIFSPGLKGLAFNTARTTLGRMDSLLKKTLNRTKLVPRIKKLWRNRVTVHKA